MDMHAEAISSAGTITTAHPVLEITAEAISDVSLSCLPVLLGVPQGSVLGSLLF